MKNVPQKIHLIIGDDSNDCDDFNELGEVTWCSDNVYDSDLTYYRKPIWHDLRENPSDLPKDERNVIACVEFDNGETASLMGCCYLNRWVLNTIFSRGSVIAWMDIPKFKD